MNQPVDPLAQVYAGPKEPPRWRRWIKGILGGIAGSSVVYMFMHMGIVVAVLQWTCEIGRKALGRPPAMQKIEDFERHIEVAIDKGKKAARKYADDEAPKEAANDAPQRIKTPVAIKKEVQKIADKVERIEHGVKKIEDTGEAVKNAPKDIIGALRGLGSGTKLAIGGVGAGIGGLWQGHKDKKDKETREALEAHAVMIGLKADPNWTLARLKAEITNAELKWNAKHGPNCQCPNQRCRFPMRVSPKGYETVRCGRCGHVFSARIGRQLWATTHPNSMHLQMHLRKR